MAQDSKSINIIKNRELISLRHMGSYHVLTTCCEETFNWHYAIGHDDNNWSGDVWFTKVHAMTQVHQYAKL